MTDDRAAIGHLTYNGDVRDTFDMQTYLGAKGPNYMGEAMFPVSVEYDPETNKTRVGYSLIPPVPLEETHRAQQVVRARAKAERYYIQRRNTKKHKRKKR